MQQPTDFLPHIDIENAVLRNQGLKINLPIPRNDLIKKAHIIGINYLEQTPTRSENYRQFVII